MSSASSHSEVISRKPSGSCLIHPSISFSSSDYDEGEEFDLISESLKEPNPEDLLRKVYYTFEDGPVYLVYPFDIVTLKPSLEVERSELLQVQEQTQPPSLFKRILTTFFPFKPNRSS